jgi:hypothetical protein
MLGGVALMFRVRVPLRFGRRLWRRGSQRRKIQVSAVFPVFRHVCAHLASEARSKPGASCDIMLGGVSLMLPVLTPLQF